MRLLDALRSYAPPTSKLAFAEKGTDTASLDSYHMS